MRALLACIVIAVLLIGAAHAQAEGPRIDDALLSPERSRIATLAAELRRGPLAVDTDAAWMLPGEDRATAEQTLREADTPIFAAFVPLLNEDESGGDGRRLARTLSEEVGRPGVYLVVSDDGRFTAVWRRVPRELPFAPEDDVPRPGYGTLQSLRLIPRLQQFTRLIDARPKGTSSGGGDYLLDMRPVHRPPDKPQSVAADLTLAGLLGALAALPFGFALRRRAR